MGIVQTEMELILKQTQQGISHEVLKDSYLSWKSIQEILLKLNLPDHRTLKDGGKVPTKKVDKTPCGLWYGKVPNLSFLKVLGCKVLVKWDTPEKLQQRSVKCIVIGYPKETMGHYSYFPPKNKIVVARYVEFLKKNILSQEVSGRVEELEEIQDKDTSPSKNTNKIHVKVKGSEPPQEKIIPIHRGILMNHYKAVMLDPKSNKWLAAMNAEIQSKKDNQVWRLVDLPPNYMMLVYDGNPKAEFRVDCYCNVGFETNKDNIKTQLMIEDQRVKTPS
nr:hypothetical protein [Tanacetum cinerariifolium]